jgi:hypothetical protein
MKLLHVISLLSITISGYIYSAQQTSNRVHKRMRNVTSLLLTYHKRITKAEELEAQEAQDRVADKLPELPSVESADLPPLVKAELRSHQQDLATVRSHASSRSSSSASSPQESPSESPREEGILAQAEESKKPKSVS